MAKGRYAEKSRHKREADVRYAIALKEADQLRAQVRELRQLRQTNETLTRRIIELEVALEAETSPRIEELKNEITILRQNMATFRKVIKEWGEENGEATAFLWNGLPHNEAFIRAVTPLMEVNARWIEPAQFKDLSNPMKRSLAIKATKDRRREAAGMIATGAIPIK